MSRSMVLKMALFLCAFAAFMALAPVTEWSLPVKLYAAAVTLGGASFLA